ncbi:hypothetical protein [Tahibacter amnicola]|uniref:Diguanylate cyclase n=1 Tax=Tahibacter amnicola TaxID=2976241 RepID=A0ABY6B8T0_9GAMM|nr:hypothetical protein [Tahibacter amnicola]UXI66486.1 hypothetical protein N4264_17250 [Tahibacter amnicola]
MVEVRTYLLGVVLPLWLIAGCADYLFHRRSAIAHTSGLGEAWLHVVQLAQIGIPVIAVLFLEVNRLVLALCTVAVVAHTVTAWWDIRYTQVRRVISAGEHLAHGFLVTLPIIALTMLLLDGAHRVADWSVRLKSVPLPLPVTVLVLAASALFGLAPTLEEWWRCWRAQRTGREGASAPLHSAATLHAAK